MWRVSCPTLRLSDPAPLTPGMEHERNRGVRRIRCRLTLRCRQLLGGPPPPSAEPALDLVALILRFTGIDVSRCPHCQQGTLVAVERIFAAPPSREASAVPGVTDSS